MTKKKIQANTTEPRLNDLLVLHRYARARPMGQKLAGTEFVKQHASELTADRFAETVKRLEKDFDEYLFVKRPKSKQETRMEYHHPEQFQVHLHGPRRPRPNGAPHPDMTPVDVGGQMTLAGELLGELASLVAGYVSVASRAVAPTPGGKRPSDEDLYAVLGFLRRERRQLHRMVTVSRDDTSSVYDLGLYLNEEVFEPEASDTQDMVTLAIPPCHPSEEYEEEPKITHRPAPKTSTVVPLSAAFRRFSRGVAKKDAV
ncbi:hypothetical protein [Devosia submarina]|uniref:hypothetical protein n=1 Tax=Devosia submarina TaxID=1173082 RepID=UPI001300A1B5|nr:hypothetical protein [Devosia submarina]